MKNICKENSKDKTAFWRMAYHFKSWEINRLRDGIYADICQAYGIAMPVISGFSYFIVSVAK